MAKKKRRPNRIIKYLLKPSVGKLLVLLMAAYFIFTTYSLATRTNVNYYEVEEGSLVREHMYTGLVIREEEIINSEASGYIYYYVADGRKAAAGQPVYSIDETGDLAAYLKNNASDTADSSSPRVKDMRSELLNDSRAFSQASFNSLYDINNSITAKAAEYSSLSIFSSMSDELKASGINFEEFYAGINGTVCCYTDGYESVDVNELSQDLFDSSDYSRSTIKAGDLIEAGSPAYKIITSENWSIAFTLSRDDETAFSESSSLKVNFPDKGFSTTVPFKIVYGTDGESYGVLSMSSYLVQFTSDRFIDFEIVTNDVSGLKIPDSAITTKDFYVIPIVYLDSDEAGNKGFNKVSVGEQGNVSEFVITDIYSTDEEYCYIECTDSSFLQPGDFVALPEGAVLDNEPQAAVGDYGSSVNESGNNDESTGADSAETNTAEEETGASASASENTENASGENDSQAETASVSDDSEDIIDGASGRFTEDEDPESVRNMSALTGDDPEDPVMGGEGRDVENMDPDNVRAEDRAYNDGNASLRESRTEEISEPKNGQKDGQETSDPSEADDAGSESSESSEAPDTPVRAPVTVTDGMYQINVMMPLKGVYNINKGYTVFRKVEVLESANGYSIIKKNTEYGLSTYDHIVLDAASVQDDQILYR